MTDGNEKTEDAAKPQVSPLEARVADLEAVVKVLAEHSRAAEHGVVVAWLEKIRAVFKRGMVGGT